MEVEFKPKDLVPLGEVEYGKCFKFPNDTSLYLLCEENPTQFDASFDGCWAVDLTTHSIHLFSTSIDVEVVDDVKVVVS